MSRLWLFLWALIENRFFSGTVRIQTERGHRVVSDGTVSHRPPSGLCGRTVRTILFIPLLLDFALGVRSRRFTGCGAARPRTALEDTHPASRTARLQGVRPKDALSSVPGDLVRKKTGDSRTGFQQLSWAWFYYSTDQINRADAQDDDERHRPGSSAPCIGSFLCHNSRRSERRCCRRCSKPKMICQYSGKLNASTNVTDSAEW
ncbi:MAG: hypothetical protein MZU91_01940 [Desulfosudis oleivorans]|nr:hypothetical protein [Desulfosudis oleivorans]